MAGIGYRTSPSGKEGFTTSLGEYDYENGDKVTFFIGDLELPEVDARGVITPLDLADTDELTHQAVLNIAILLQSLDSDGNPANGITINYEQIVASATAIASFDVDPVAFSTNISGFVSAAGGTLVSVESAQAHLQSTIENLDTLTAERLIGTWLIDGDDYRAIVAFLDATRYISIEVTEEETTNLEVGTYQWNASTGVITATPNGEAGEEDLGLKPAVGSYLITASGDQLLIAEQGDDEPPVVMTKLNSESGLTGGWYYQEEGTIVLTAFTETNYFMGQYVQDSQDEWGHNGIEYGTYTYNPVTKEYRVETVIDTNFQWGFSHPCAVLDLQDTNDLSCAEGGSDILQTMTRTGDKLTFVSEADTLVNGGEEQPVNFTKVGAATEMENIVLEVEVTNTVTEATQGERFEAPGASMQCGAGGLDEAGTSETFPETWTLNPNFSGVSAVSDEKYSDDPYADTGFFDLTFSKLQINNAGSKINLCAAGEATCDSDVIFYSHNSYTWTADINLNLEAGVIATGEIIETMRLSWNLDSRVSVCTIRYSVSATRLSPP